MNYFIPTWLMVKQHRITGLKYFCKTIKKDPYKYKGSGIRWCNHLKKHGRNVDTLWCMLFYNKEELVEYAINFSKENNIVESDEWANLVIEDGITGWPTGTKHKEETKIKCKHNNGFKKGYVPYNKGMKMSQDFCDTQSKKSIERIKSKTHNMLTDEFKEARLKSENKRLEIISRRCVIDGVTYSSAKEAHRTIGVKYCTIIKRLQSNSYLNYYWEDEFNKKKKENNRLRKGVKHLEIDGVYYYSVLIASTTLKLTKASIMARIKSKNYPTYKWVE